MAKATSGSQSQAALASIRDMLTRVSPFSHKEATQIITTFLHRDPSIPDIWDPNAAMSRCPVLIGEAGCGKTKMIRDLCRKMEMELRFMPTGASLDEDMLAIPEQYNQSEVDRLEYETWRLVNPDADIRTCPAYQRLCARATGSDIKELTFRDVEIGGVGMASRFRVKPPAWAPVDPPQSKSGLGVLFIDELLTASDMQQNQISLSITQRGFGGMRWADGWFIIGASNPPTDAYFLSKDPDARLLARLWLVPLAPNAEDTMRYFADNNILTEKMYGFLLMNKGHILAVDNRTWEDVGHQLKQNESCGIMSTELETRILSCRIPDVIVTAYNAYCKFGNDPYHYPIAAKTLMQSTGAAHAQHIDLFARWEKDGKDAMIACTAHDLISYVADPTFKMTQEMANNVIDFVYYAGTDLASHIFRSTHPGNTTFLPASRNVKPPKGKVHLRESIKKYFCADDEAASK